MPGMTWSGLIEAEQARHTVDGQIFGSGITDEDDASRTTRPGLRVPIPWMLVIWYSRLLVISVLCRQYSGMAGLWILA